MLPRSREIRPCFFGFLPSPPVYIRKGGGEARGQEDGQLFDTISKDMQMRGRAHR